jgi:Predicted integral membrane protein
MNIRAPLLPGWLRWLAVLAVATFVFYTSIVTTPPATIIDERPAFLPLDKWRHFLAYATLGFGLAYATTDWRLRVRALAALVVATTVLYGVGVEVGQSFIPGRQFSPVDAYANTLGGALSLTWYLLCPHVEFVSPGSFVEAIAERAPRDWLP